MLKRKEFKQIKKSLFDCNHLSFELTHVNDYPHVKPEGPMCYYYAICTYCGCSSCTIIFEQNILVFFLLILTNPITL